MSFIVHASLSCVATGNQGAAVQRNASDCCAEELCLSDLVQQSVSMIHSMYDGESIARVTLKFRTVEEAVQGATLVL